MISKNEVTATIMVERQSDRISVQSHHHHNRQ